LSNVLIFDLETSDLSGNRGHIMCATAKWLDDKHIYTWRIDDTPGYGTTPKSYYDDSALSQEIGDLCEEAQVVVAYYGSYRKFDVPFLNTRRMGNQQLPLKRLTIVDPYLTAKSQLKLARTSMDAVASLLGLDVQKYHLPWADWQRAKFGDKKAMDSLLEYCENDVLVLEGIYKKFLPMFTNHPYTTEGGPYRCPACGSSTMSKGWRYLKRVRVQDRLCGKCGWRGDGTREKL
jgi:uncharacterized protein YprB with RNaseH-like and TPR domain